MARIERDPEVATQTAEVVVREVGHQLAAELFGAQGRSIESQPHARELSFYGICKSVGVNGVPLFKTAYTRWMILLRMAFKTHMAALPSAILRS